ncbi:hypothetical protein ACJMK2_013116 [Sinanodonta woodiana]|uniref:G-protein coupled receptors family 1 profile domain-containing protein n=1 Tax=Sinanodonta woodiana TaxID=1069815 RepID=A0ABD3VAB4_SINWO
MIVGIPGNELVIRVYLQENHPSTPTRFIVCLAMIDLASCCLSVPFFLTVLRYSINFLNSFKQSARYFTF